MAILYRLCILRMGFGIMNVMKRAIYIFLCTAIFFGCSSVEKTPEVFPTQEIIINTAPQSTDSATSNETVTVTPAKEPYKTDEYNISIEINPESRTVSGVEKLTYQNRTGQPMDKIYFNVYLNAFSSKAGSKPYFSNFESKIFQNGVDYADINISNVTIDSQAADFSLSETVLTITLPDPLMAEEMVEVALLFDAYVPKINHRTGANDDAMWFGNFLPVVAVYDADGWHTEPYYPAGDPFYSNISNYNVKVTAPKEYIVAGTGEETIAEAGDKKTTVFTAKMVRDFAFAVSKNYKVDTIKTVGGKYINFYHYSDMENVADFLYTAKRSLDYYSEAIGSYPYVSFDIIEIGLFISGGMEYSEVTFIDSEYLKTEPSFHTLAHEIAHQYFYNIIGSNQIKEAWLDEALASYMELGVFYSSEEIDQKMSDGYEILKIRMKNFYSRSMIASLSVYEDWSNYYNVQYNRGMLMLHSLKNKMGGAKFDEFIKTYYTKYSFKKSNKNEFILTAQEVYGGDLTQFFKGWLEDYDLPALYY